MKLQIHIPFSFILLGYHGNGNGNGNGNGSVVVKAFQPLSLSSSSIPSRSRGTTTQLNDVSEWRDIMFDAPPVLNNYNMEDYQEGPLREVCILPFPLDDALIQGETKELCLYEERFHKLFTKSIEEHGGVVAMGLLAPPAGILQTMPLCEIETFRTMEGDTGFGTSYSILATIRSIGRASLIYIDDDDDGSDGEREFLTGWCTELGDDASSSSSGVSSSNTDDLKKIPEVANRMADRCEEVFDSIQELEEKITQMEREVGVEFVQSEATLRRKLLEAELELELAEDDDDEEDDDDDEYLFDDDDDDDDDSDDDELNERNALQRAFQLAKSTDTQGYRISSSTTESESNNDNAMRRMRSIQDLTALSWAYFSTELESDAQEMLSYRLRALEIVNLSDRLKLALVMMMERRSKLRATLRGMADDDGLDVDSTDSTGTGNDAKRNWEDDDEDNISL